MPGYQVKVPGNVTRVQDSFNRGVLQPSGSLIWSVCNMNILPVTTPFAIGNAACQAVGTGQMVLSCYGQTNPLYSAPAALQCIALTSRLLWGQTQYAQVKYISQLGNLSAGPAVMVDVQGVNSGGGCYAILFIGPPGTRLVKMVGGSSLWTESDLIAPIPGDVQSNGDVYRLSCQRQGASNFLTVTKNGTVIATFTDNTPLTTGVPGLTEVSLSIAAGVPGQLIVSAGDFGLGL